MPRPAAARGVLSKQARHHPLLLKNNFIPHGRPTSLSLATANFRVHTSAVGKAEAGIDPRSRTRPDGASGMHTREVAQDGRPSSWPIFRAARGQGKPAFGLELQIAVLLDCSAGRPRRSAKPAAPPLPGGRHRPQDRAGQRRRRRKRRRGGVWRKSSSS